MAVWPLKQRKSSGEELVLFIPARSMSENETPVLTISEKNQHIVGMTELSAAKSRLATIKVSKKTG
jgi:hypothetical protein